MANADIVNYLKDLTKGFEDPIRKKAIRKAITSIEKYPLRLEGPDARDLTGIGDWLADKICNFLRSDKANAPDINIQTESIDSAYELLSQHATAVTTTTQRTLSTLKLTELRAKCKASSLSVSGNKSEIIERLITSGIGVGTAQSSDSSNVDSSGVGVQTPVRQGGQQTTATPARNRPSSDRKHQDLSNNGKYPRIRIGSASYAFMITLHKQTSPISHAELFRSAQVHTKAKLTQTQSQKSRDGPQQWYQGGAHSLHSTLVKQNIVELCGGNSYRLTEFGYEFAEHITAVITNQQTKGREDVSYQSEDQLTHRDPDDFSDLDLSKFGSKYCDNDSPNVEGVVSTTTTTDISTSVSSQSSRYPIQNRDGNIADLKYRSKLIKLEGTHSSLNRFECSTEMTSSLNHQNDYTVGCNSKSLYRNQVPDEVKSSTGRPSSTTPHQIITNTKIKSGATPSRYSVDLSRDTPQVVDPRSHHDVMITPERILKKYESTCSNSTDLKTRNTFSLPQSRLAVDDSKANSNNPNIVETEGDLKKYSTEYKQSPPLSHREEEDEHKSKATLTTPKSDEVVTPKFKPQKSLAAVGSPCDSESRLQEAIKLSLQAVSVPQTLEEEERLTRLALQKSLQDFESNDCVQSTSKIKQSKNFFSPESQQVLRPLPDSCRKADEMVSKGNQIIQPALPEPTTLTANRSLMSSFTAVEESDVTLLEESNQIKRSTDYPQETDILKRRKVEEIIDSDSDSNSSFNKAIAWLDESSSDGKPEDEEEEEVADSAESNVELPTGFEHFYYSQMPEQSNDVEFPNSVPDTIDSYDSSPTLNNTTNITDDTASLQQPESVLPPVAKRGTSKTQFSPAPPQRKRVDWRDYKGDKVVKKRQINDSQNDEEYVLLIDTRERKDGDREKFYSKLKESGVTCERRQLEIGDFLWIKRFKGIPTSEIMLDIIIERKQSWDLASSIVSGRYNDQKRRMISCGLKRPIYLLEGESKNQRKLPAASLDTAMLTTSLFDGLSVIQTKNFTGSISFLVAMHAHIVKCSGVLGEGAPVPPPFLGGGSEVEPRQGEQLSYCDWSQSARTATQNTTRDNIFPLQLSCIRGVGPDAACAIAQVHSTPASLYNTFSQLVTAGRPAAAELSLSTIPLTSSRTSKIRFIGDSVSSAIFRSFYTLK